jgi:hypothetical protein
MPSRALQGKYGVGFRTVQKALASVWPWARKPLPAWASWLDPFKPVIDEMLRVELDAFIVTDAGPDWIGPIAKQTLPPSRLIGGWEPESDDRAPFDF